ncbi:MAG: hypothetical protein ABIX01_12145 [Chitinophagaceae bacterium]
MLTANETAFLGDDFNKDHLQKYHLPMAKRFFDRNPIWYSSTAPIMKAAAELLLSKPRSKQELAVVCFAPLFSRETYIAFLKAQPAWFAIVMEKLVWQETLRRDEVEKVIGETIYILNSSNTEYEYLPELYYFSIEKLYGYNYSYGKSAIQKYNDEPVLFSISVSFRAAVTNYYPKPAGYTLNPFPIWEKTADSYIFNAEKAIQQEMGGILSYHTQGNIKYSEKGRPAITGMKKVQKALAIKEFYASDDNDLHPIRTMLVCGMLRYMKSYIGLAPTLPGAIKKMFAEFFTKFEHPSSIASFILNQIKGFSTLNNWEYKRDAVNDIWRLMEQMPAEGWISWDNIQTWFQTHFIDPIPIHSRHYGKIYYEDKERQSYNNKVYVNNGNKQAMLQWPFTKGCMYLFASYGLLEIAYTGVDTKRLAKTWNSEYDGLQGLRLTALGKYVLGKTDVYEPPELESLGKLLFDEESLIIRAEGNLDLMTTLLGNYVEKVSSNRFAFRPALFLKDCKNVKQIQEKLILFRKSLNVKLPPYWEEALAKMISNATAIAERREFHVFKINEQDKQLLRVIAQDDFLKTVVIKAEGFLILVDNMDKSPFKRRLSELGYFVEL